MAVKSTYSTKTVFDKVDDKVWEQIVNQTISANDGNIQFETNGKTKKFSETEIKSPEIEKSVENILIEKDIENAEKEVDNDSMRKISINEVNVYGKYSCNQCYYQSICKHNLISHVEIYHEGMVHQCPKCQFKANRKHYLQWHMKSTHDGVKI